jgi:5-methylcytosine-specific restriction endonuclease McrA
MSQRKKQIRATFRDDVFKRDGHKCVMCESTEDLAAHHVTDRTLMPNGGYVRENGITVCPHCHECAEQYHITQGAKFDEGWHPFDLYEKIGSSFDAALEASERLS